MAKPVHYHEGKFMRYIPTRQLVDAILTVILGMAVFASAAITENTPLKEFGYGQLESNVAFSPDGKTFAAGSSTGKVRIFDLDSGNVGRSHPK